MPHNIFEVCRRCHTEAHTIGMNEMARKYVQLTRLLIEKGWKWDDILLKWTHQNERNIVGPIT